MTKYAFVCDFKPALPLLRIYLLSTDFFLSIGCFEYMTNIILEKPYSGMEGLIRFLYIRVEKSPHESIRISRSVVQHWSCVLVRDDDSFNYRYSGQKGNPSDLCTGFHVVVGILPFLFLLRKRLRMNRYAIHSGKYQSLCGVWEGCNNFSQSTWHTQLTVIPGLRITQATPKRTHLITLLERVALFFWSRTKAKSSRSLALLSY